MYCDYCSPVAVITMTNAPMSCYSLSTFFFCSVFKAGFPALPVFLMQSVADVPLNFHPLCLCCCQQALSTCVYPCCAAAGGGPLLIHATSLKKQLYFRGFEYKIAMSDAPIYVAIVVTDCRPPRGPAGLSKGEGGFKKKQST